MKANTRPVIVFVTVLSCFAVFLFLSSKMIILESFAKLEEKNAAENLQRALCAVSDDLAQLNTVVGDNAGWDVAYRFVKNGNSEFIKANCEDPIFPKLRINLYVYTKDSFFKTTLFC